MLPTDSVLPLSLDHITAIGRVTAYFSLLEQLANTIIADLLGLKSRDDVISVTAHMTAAGKVQLIRTLASTKLGVGSELRVFLDETLKVMDEVKDQRNDIVHAHWYYYSPSNNESGHLKQTARGSIKTKLQGYTPDQINDIALRIFETTGRLQQFLIKKNGSLYFG